LNRILWTLQIVLAAIAAFTGIMHFVVPPDLPAPLHWMYALPTPIHYIAGTAELLAALGLLLPGLTRMHARLTPLAALGLAIVMIGAIVFHVSRGEGLAAAINVIIAALAALVAYGRWQIPASIPTQAEATLESR